MTITYHIPTTRRMQVFNGRYFSIKSGWQDKLEAIGLSAEEDWTRLSSQQEVSASYHTTHTYCFSLENGEQIFFKRYVYRKPRLKHWLQPSKAVVEAAGYDDLIQLGIPTPEVLAYGEHRTFGILKAAFIVTRGIPDVTGLDLYLARCWLKMDYAIKIDIYRKLKSQLISQIQQAHANGFFHQDIKLRNLLVNMTKDSPRIYWIDCPHSRTSHANNFRGIVTDFIAMARVGYRVLTPGQRMRFLLDYTNHNRELARRIYRVIAKAFEKKPPRPLWHLLSVDDPAHIAGKQKIKS